MSFENRRKEILSRFRSKILKLNERSAYKYTKIPKLNLRIQNSLDIEKQLPTKKAKNDVGIQCFEPEQDSWIDISSIQKQYDKFKQVSEIDEQIKYKREYLGNYKQEDTTYLEFEIAKLEYELSKVPEIDYNLKLLDYQQRAKQNTETLSQLTQENIVLSQCEESLRQEILKR